MPGKRKKTTTVVEELPPNLEAETDPEPTEFDVSLESVEDPDTLSEILSQFGETTVNLKILRQVASGNPEFCFQTDHLDEEFIQKNFGGGTYIVRIFINGKFRHHIKINIANRIDSATAQGAFSFTSRSDGGSSNDYRHSEFLEKQAQRNHELLLAAIGNKGSTGPTITEIISALSGLDALRGKQESTMELFLKGVEFAQTSDGKTDWKTDAIRSVKEVLGPALPGVISAITGNRVPPPVPGQEPPMQIPPDAIIHAGIQYLKKKAIAGVDPDLIIEWVVNNAEEYQELLRVVLNQEFADIAKLDPEIGSEPFASWFKPLFDGLRSAFNPSNPVDTDSGGSSGNDSNSGNHGKPRPVGVPKSAS